MLTALLLAAATAPAPACAAAVIQAQVSAAAAKMTARDLAGARAAIAPALGCPVTGSVAYSARVLRADIAVRQDDWTGVRDALAGAGFHPETRIGVRAAAFQLRADEKLGDAKAFAADRTATVAGNDAILAGLGRKVEEFHAGKAAVHAFEAAVRQDKVRRVLEFIVVPDAPGAYPRSILLTDTGTGWTVDGYACGRHAVLDQPAAAPDGTPPAYDAVKAVVTRTLETQGVSGPWAGVTATDAKPNAAGLCANIAAILPGIGARAEPPPPAPSAP